jgi:hypothetical protein
MIVVNYFPMGTDPHISEIRFFFCIPVVHASTWIDLRCCRGPDQGVISDQPAAEFMAAVWTYEGGVVSSASPGNNKHPHHSHAGSTTIRLLFSIVLVFPCMDRSSSFSDPFFPLYYVRIRLRVTRMRAILLASCCLSK